METLTEIPAGGDPVSALAPYLPVAAVALAVLIMVYVVVSELRDSRRPASPEDGCDGCPAPLGDALVGDETYCWTCIDAWPSTAMPLADLHVAVFPGRERGGAR